MSHIEAIVAIIVAIFASQGFWAWVMSRGSRRRNNDKLLLGIAYAKIVEKCERHISDGYISSDDYHELRHYLYEPYEANGGNGTAKRLMLEVDKLTIKKEGDPNVTKS